MMLLPALGAAQGLPVLRGCSVQQQGQSLRLRLELGAQVAYRSFRLTDPERVVIDLSGVSSQSPRIDPMPAGAAVARIRSAHIWMVCASCSTSSSHVRPTCTGKVAR